MRVLRATTQVVTFLLISLSAVIWVFSLAAVDYSVAEATSVHYLGRRLYYLEVGYPTPALLCCGSMLPFCLLLCSCCRRLGGGDTTHAKLKLPPFMNIMASQKVSYELDALEAAAKGLSTLHTYEESIVALKDTLTSLRDAHLTVTSGMKGAVADSTTEEVRARCRPWQG